MGDVQSVKLLLTTHAPVVNILGTSYINRRPMSEPHVPQRQRLLTLRPL